METYEKVQFDKDVPMKFGLIEIEKGKHGFVNKHWHRSVEILLPLEGKVFVWISGKNIELKKGGVFIINSREIHSVYGDNEHYKGYMIQIEYDFLVSCFKDMDSIYFEQINDYQVNKELFDLIEKINIYYNEDDDYKNIIIEAMLLMIVHTLLSSQKRIRSDGRIIDSDRNRRRIINITEYIEKNYAENLTVEMLADKFNLSYGHFVRLFKENLNMTVKEYINNVRINKCRDELLNTDYSIVHIALENGFPNIQSFYKEFNKMYKTTPARFRKMSQINNENDSLKQY